MVGTGSPEPLSPYFEQRLGEASQFFLKAKAKRQIRILFGWTDLSDEAYAVSDSTTT